ncbi:MAG: polymorphic toxin type 44 domain-containing protein [Stellaceae bacterium]
MRDGYPGMIPQLIDEVAEGFGRIAKSLNAGDHVRARILAVQMRVPGLTPSAMAKLAKAAGLQKYNPNWGDEARVPAGDSDGGQWAGGDGADASDGNPTPVQIAQNDAGVASDPTNPSASSDGKSGPYVVLNDGTTPTDHLGKPLKIPPGVSLEDNARLGQSIREFATTQPGMSGGTARLGMMVGLFAPHIGSMDYQRIFGTDGKINKDYVDFGNYNYGVVAAAAGFSLGEAVFAHGVVNQLGQGDKSGPWGGNPRDITMIQNGYADYNSGKIVLLPKKK